MKKNEAIKSIMTTDVVTVQLGEAPSKVRHILSEASFHHVPVLDGERLVGVISTVDFMRASLAVWGTDERSVDALLDSQLKLADLMNGELTTIPASATVRDAAGALAQGDFHSLPVVDDGGALRGIVTSTDLIRYLLDQY